ncbi:flagellar biosynthesis anti-sigma factor FlgM [Shewanella cyperi]|uniref:flagellar biosynthesis anti-sigma factor FlgM n=1 Tax=Shewanella cyperi TaxID=2814292 RepID=UPI001A93FFB0|nr:flagellar biosynthesis anti-sigma factor FlgM [Shewanella cyperi]QSX39708.1 flagellar biosynthesis anti-sigma factor FlgM [Shewanella cyperi]
MAMDIKQSNAANAARVRASNTPAQQVQQQSAKTEQTQGNGAAHKNDSVVITSQAQQLQGIQSRMAALPDVDQKKIAEIKQAIAEGRYKVDPEKLAANIARFEKDMQDLDSDA